LDTRTAFELIEKQQISDIDPAFGHDRAGEPIPNRRSPGNFEALCGKRFQDACFVPNSITLIAPPLRPIFGVQGKFKSR